MKFIVGKKLEDNVLVLEGEKAGIYETNMEFEDEDFEVLGFENGHIVFETPETPGLIDEIKQSYDANEKIYAKCICKEDDHFNVRTIDEVALSDGKTVREKIMEIKN